MTEVEIFSIGPREALRVASLLTEEALELICGMEAFGLCVVDENEVRGAISARISPENDQILEILSLYVTPAHRKEKLGGTLLMELLERSMEATDGMLQQAVITFSSRQKELENLLKRAGFEIEEVFEKSFYVTLSDLKESFWMKSSAVSGASILPMGKLNDYQMNQLYHILQRNNADYLSPEEMKRVHPEASYVFFDREQKPRACSLIDVRGDKDIGLVQFFTEGKEPAPALSVLRASVKALLGAYPENAVLEIPVLTDSSESLVHKLLGDDLKSESMLQAILTLS